MKTDRRVYVVGGGNYYANWLECKIVHRMEDSTIVLFTGGEDISSHLYGKRSHPSTYSNLSRDMEEIDEFKKAKELDLPMLGICRGSQALCVFSHGILVQDQQHPYLHNIETSDGEILLINSIHHQRQYPFNLPADEYELIAWAVDENGNEQLSPFDLGETDEDDMTGEKEAEIVFYKRDGMRLLAIQSHPEMAYPPKREWEEKCISYCRSLVEKYLET